MEENFNFITEAIKVENFSFRYMQAKRQNYHILSYKEVLKNINFTVNVGEKISIIGPNGAGKSTLLLNIAGLMEEYLKENKNNSGGGNIYIFGKQMNLKNIYDIRENIGFVFQNPDDQLFSTSVFEDVAFGLVNFLKKNNDLRASNMQYIKDTVIETLNKVNLKNKEDEIPHFLSFGEKKLAALATALSYNPKILILDEPSSNLDPKNRENFINLIKSLNKTMIISTHDMDLAYEFSERCIILNNGEIVYDGITKEILKNKEFLLENGLDLPLSFRSYVNV
ncbi:MAG: energy-coupling factor ABC transporter ATP-binding protein [Actinobacteria bacterium]|nr:energy-coupling factor ABC transporter ATP-binding protein [Cyanobacteriota bacterium]MCL5771610.1 energy-coupling factor ABC transporter ATP-binding protein [Actinomycetota bacterium]